jgi:hypothetical protein
MFSGPFGTISKLNKRKHSEKLIAAESRYLRLLGATNIKKLEEQVISTILSGIDNQIKQRSLPIRLSKIAASFLIQPVPQRIQGSHDGELNYDQDKNSFVIKLCSPNAREEQARTKRDRFTYAHEMAHRFFFLEHAERGWIRALDLSTENLSASQALLDRWHLNNLEESLCNRIARRVLIPDTLLLERCRLDQWFSGEHTLYRHLSKTANDFGVSRECLIVGISSAIRRKVIEATDSVVLMVIGKTTGPINRRGKEALRVSVCSFPKRFLEYPVDAPFPGFELRRFGSEAEEFFERAITNPAESHGEISIPISLKSKRSEQTVPTPRLVGWWNSYGGLNPGHRKLCVWGKLTI